MKILVTGLIASGKTRFSQILARLSGLPLFSNDEIAKKIKTDVKVQRKLMRMFRIEDPHGIDDAIRSAISDTGIRRKLNAILHPLIKREDKRILKEHEDCIIDSPIPRSLGILGLFDLIVLVTAPEPVVAERLKGKKFSADAAAALLEAQKVEFAGLKADHTVLNDGATDLEKAASDIVFSY